MTSYAAAVGRKPLALPALSVRTGTSLLLSSINGLVIFVIFMVLFVSLHPVQYLALPLYYVHRPSFRWIQNYVKRTWVVFLTLITQHFGPSTLVITSDITEEEFISFEGDQVYAHFPHKFVTIANHQIYLDWIYLWILAYLGGREGDFLIMLKYSLQFAPFLGPAMKFFNFIWMKRNWLADQKSLAAYLTRLVKVYKDLPMMLVIFPEGTLVSRETRPLSARYAKKMDIDDLRNVLLPRSTGLKFCLEKLQTGVEYVYDFTIGYEGIPPPSQGSYGQDYFTLRSVYFSRESPPRVHLHLRRFALREMPLGEGQTQAFDVWLRERWAEKDRMLEAFYQHHEFPLGKDGKRHSVLTKTRHLREWAHLTGCGVPWLVAYVAYRAYHLVRA